MFRRFVALMLSLCMLANASVALAAEAAKLPARTLYSVNVQRGGDENPVKEIAKSVAWGALAGLLVGSAVALAAKDDSGDPVRWGIVIGTFGGLAAGIYFVSHRPQPTSLLELRDGRLVPNAAALTAIEPVPGGMRVHAIGVGF
jgi:hypothetical protein